MSKEFPVRFLCSVLSFVDLSSAKCCVLFCLLKTKSNTPYAQSAWTVSLVCNVYSDINPVSPIPV